MDRAAQENCGLHFNVSIVHRRGFVSRIASIRVFAKELRQLRLKAGLTQEEVGSRAGVSREYVSMLEGGKNVPTIDVFVRLCRAIDVSPAELITRVARSIRSASRP